MHNLQVGIFAEAFLGSGTGRGRTACAQCAAHAPRVVGRVDVRCVWVCVTVSFVSGVPTRPHFGHDIWRMTLSEAVEGV